MKKKGMHGGKREGAGRRPDKEGELRDRVFSIRLTSEEMAILDATQARKWARDVLLKSARRRQK